MSEDKMLEPYPLSPILSDNKHPPVDQSQHHF